MIKENDQEFEPATQEAKDRGCTCEENSLVYDDGCVRMYDTDVDCPYHNPKIIYEEEE